MKFTTHVPKELVGDMSKMWNIGENGFTVEVDLKTTESPVRLDILVKPAPTLHRPPSYSLGAYPVDGGR
jgi:hypothetical protein